MGALEAAGGAGAPVKEKKFSLREALFSEQSKNPTSLPQSRKPLKNSLNFTLNALAAPTLQG